MAPKRTDGRAAYLETEPARQTAARLQLFCPLMSAYCFPEVRSPCSTGFWFPKSLESLAAQPDAEAHLNSAGG